MQYMNFFNKIIEKISTSRNQINISSGVVHGDIIGGEFSKNTKYHDGANITVNRQVEDYEGIRISSSINIFFTVSEKEYISIEAPESLIDNIITEVVSSNKDNADKILSISLKGSNVIRGHIRVNIYGPNIRYVNSKSSGSIQIKGIKQDTIYIEMSGSGTVDIQGKTTKLDIKASGSGTLKANTLYSETINSTTSGSGTTILTATKEVNIKSSGSGTTIINGNPKNKQINNRGSGSVIFK